METVCPMAYTSLDRKLCAAAIDGVVAPPHGRTAYERFQTKLLLARLRTLEKMRLAAREKDGWRLAPDLEETLQEAGRRGDIIRSMGAAMGLQFEPAKFREFGAAGSPPRIVGRVVGEGAADDAHDKRFLALDGADGNQWHVAFDGAPGTAPPEGAIVEASLASAAPRKFDRTIAEIAAHHDGMYSDALHARCDPSANPEYRLAHKRRLEALRRAGIGDRLADGTWRISRDFLERTAQFEAAKAPARMRTLSWVGLDALTTAPVRTFLDEAIEQGEDSRGALGFGGALQKAFATRRNWLLAQGLAQENENGFADSRANVFGLLQDEWSIAPDWTVTLGVRFDHFSNFGLTINPRASVVWNANPTLTVKALYGSAFRAPTFLEETEGSGQIARGNQNLEPEMIDTAEIVLEQRWSDVFETSVTGYAYALANLSLEYRPRQITGLFVRVAATNLLDKRALEPSPNLIFPTDDIPLEGRKIIARIGVSR